MSLALALAIAGSFVLTAAEPSKAPGDRPPPALVLTVFLDAPAASERDAAASPTLEGGTAHVSRREKSASLTCGPRDPAARTLRCTSPGSWFDGEGSYALSVVLADGRASTRETFVVTHPVERVELAALLSLSPSAPELKLWSPMLLEPADPAVSLTGKKRVAVGEASKPSFELVNGSSHAVYVAVDDGRALGRLERREGESWHAVAPPRGHRAQAVRERMLSPGGRLAAAPVIPPGSAPLKQGTYRFRVLYTLEPGQRASKLVEELPSGQRYREAIFRFDVVSSEAR